MVDFMKICKVNIHDSNNEISYALYYQLVSLKCVSCVIIEKLQGKISKVGVMRNLGKHVYSELDVQGVNTYCNSTQSMPYYFLHFRHNSGATTIDIQLKYAACIFLMEIFNVFAIHTFMYIQYLRIFVSLQTVSVIIKATAHLNLYYFPLGIFVLWEQY